MINTVVGVINVTRSFMRMCYNMLMCANRTYNAGSAMVVIIVMMVIVNVGMLFISLAFVISLATILSLTCHC